MSTVKKRKPMRRKKVGVMGTNGKPHVLQEVENEFRLLYITGKMSSNEIVEKYADLGAKKKNVEHYLRTRGITQMKRDYADKQLELSVERSEEIEVAARQEQLKVLLKERRAEALIHQKWMDEQLKGSRDRIVIDPESVQKLDKHLVNLKMISDMATDHYGLGKQEADERAVQVQIIMNLNDSDIKEKTVEAKVIDV